MNWEVNVFVFSLDIGVRGSPERDMLLLGAGGEGGGSGQTRVRHAPPPPPRADLGNFGPPSRPGLAPLFDWNSLNPDLAEKSRFSSGKLQNEFLAT